MNYNYSKIICIGLLVFTLIFCNGCSSSIPTIELKESYGFSNKEEISLYVIPSDNQILDETYSRVLQLDLQSRGYKIINVNQLLIINSDLITGANHRQIADLLLVKKDLPFSDVIVVAQPEWDSVYFATDLREKYTSRGILTRYYGKEVLTLSSEVAFYDRSIRQPIKSFSALDTCRVYREMTKRSDYYSEFPWMLAARQLTRNLKDIPVCTIVNLYSASTKFNICFWVDESYREAFPREWKNRLVRRVLYANDILRSQFDIEIVITEFKEWDSRFEICLDKTLENLRSETTSDSKVFNIGITFNELLKRNWTEKSNIGYAILLGTDAVITGQPSLPEIGFWNPLEESITLVHEFGHLLGALHVSNERSIMFPYAGSLSYKFDEFNQGIIEEVKSSFYADDEQEHVRNYVQKLIELRKTSPNDSILIVEAIANVSINLIQERYSDYPGPKELSSSLSNVIPDSVYRLAVIGYVEFELQHYEQAKDCFLKVIELEPDFAEVQDYLHIVQVKLDNKTADRNDKAATRPNKTETSTTKAGTAVNKDEPDTNKAKSGTIKNNKKPSKKNR
ncbi:M12 family metallo-peptidase [Bacteroidota bacterium]